MTNTTEQYDAAEEALFSLLHVNPSRVGHLSTDSIYKAARGYVAAVDAIRETGREVTEPDEYGTPPDLSDRRECTDCGDPLGVVAHCEQCFSCHGDVSHCCQACYGGYCAGCGAKTLPGPSYSDDPPLEVKLAVARALGASTLDASTLDEVMWKMEEGT
jgi:hypothetical protein